MTANPLISDPLHVPKINCVVWVPPVKGGEWKVMEMETMPDGTVFFVASHPFARSRLYKRDVDTVVFVGEVDPKTKGDLPKEMSQTRHGVLDELDARIQKRGGFSTSLKFADLKKLRAIVKKVHMRHYPSHMITDHEADRIIDVMAPETWTYLLEKHKEQ